MRCERDAALRMIGRTQSMKLPDRTRHRAISERIPLSPPKIPKPAQIIVRAGLLTGKFGREQATDAEQPRLKSEGAEIAGGRSDARAQFRQSLHRPDVVFVAQGAQPAFPQGLFPARLPRARLKLNGLGL